MNQNGTIVIIILCMIAIIGLTIYLARTVMSKFITNTLEAKDRATDSSAA
ncbi:hypothetical protein MCOR27_000723 [Pyricularia oryzae]|uniref:Uncharacterized protein n=5 Tax=Pyricularia TaxID=48558 RepID=A0ABQ8P263_PYRGI|nr:uncharacterized protein MGG_17742 [Pyricularia oryzae 70-15]ELQ44492.1 hypothetical protein OOU_Y34scaffold00085g8 [Pyricularia oryzae Y34]KAH8846180.1 hypothetical protein MCOR01_003384 [Pyricularia oryzae]KAI6304399.1 hypothetical protein MCOR33_000494 [Pyricularia grisea]EHA47685.1 hypothetical protein MGG_17742 [Pyricularia oryzae 70-15]KAH9432312.1 hypothetical protein MCOR02_007015 [Pyricularia oryzae]